MESLACKLEVVAYIVPDCSPIGLHVRPVMSTFFCRHASGTESFHALLCGLVPCPCMNSKRNLEQSVHEAAVDEPYFLALIQGYGRSHISHVPSLLVSDTWHME